MSRILVLCWSQLLSLLSCSIRLGKFRRGMLKDLSDYYNLFCPQYCWNAGGYLAEFESLEEEQALDSILWFIASSYWIGLSDSAHEDTWRWQESNEEPSYTNWAPEEPNNFNGDEDCCMKQCSTDPTCKWNAYPCYISFAHAFCKMKK